MTAEELYWNLFKEQVEHARHHEAQRATVAGVLTAIAAGLIAFIADNEVTRADIAPSAFLVCLGAIGLLFSLKYHHLFRQHQAIASGYMRALNARLRLKDDWQVADAGDHSERRELPAPGDWSTDSIREAGWNDFKTRTWEGERLKLPRLWQVWLILYVFIMWYVASAYAW